MPANKYMEENGLAAMLATKRSAGVAPRVNLREYVICMPMPNMNKAVHSCFETQRRCDQKSKTGVSVAPQKDFWLRKFEKSMLISKRTCENIRGTTCQ